MGLFGGDSPKAPSLKHEAATSGRQAGIAYGNSQQQQDWARDQWSAQQQQMDNTTRDQNRAAGDLYAWGRSDRALYDEYGQPLVKQMMQDAADWNNPDTQNRQAAQYQASVTQAMEAQRQNAQRNLESYGIDPSQTRSQALDLEARVNSAAQQAAAGNMGRQAAQQTGQALRQAAVGVGLQSAGQAVGQYGNAANMGSNALGNMNSTINTGAGTMGTGMGWQAQGLGAIAQQANIKSQAFQNKLGAHGAEGGGALGQLVGMGAGAAGSYYGAKGAQGPQGAQEGGEIGGDPATWMPPGPEDTVPAMLAEGEYVIPREVVERKGTEFFDKLKDKTMADVDQKKASEAEKAQAAHASQGNSAPVQGLQYGGPVEQPYQQAVQITPANLAPQGMNSPEAKQGMNEAANAMGAAMGERSAANAQQAAKQKAYEGEMYTGGQSAAADPWGNDFQMSTVPRQGLQYGGLVQQPYEQEVQVTTYQPPQQQQQQQEEGGPDPMSAYQMYQQQMAQQGGQTAAQGTGQTAGQGAGQAAGQGAGQAGVGAGQGAAATTAAPAATTAAPAAGASAAPAAGASAAPAAGASAAPAGGGGSMMGATLGNPWVWLAAAIIANESNAKSKGYRGESSKDHAKMIATGENLEVDMTERFPEELGMSVSDNKYGDFYKDAMGSATTKDPVKGAKRGNKALKFVGDEASRGVNKGYKSIGKTGQDVTGAHKEQTQKTGKAAQKTVTEPVKQTGKLLKKLFS